MLARHLFHLAPSSKLIHTNSTLVHLRVIRRLLSDLHRREGINRRFRSGRGTVTVRIILSKLLDKLLEPGTDEVIPHVSSEAESGRFRAAGVVFDDELDLSTTGVKIGEAILNKRVGIESERVGVRVTERVRVLLMLTCLIQQEGQEGG
jgi:hypothetical protein